MIRTRRGAGAVVAEPADLHLPSGSAPRPLFIHKFGHVRLAPVDRPCLAAPRRSRAAPRALCSSRRPRLPPRMAPAPIPQWGRNWAPRGPTLELAGLRSTGVAATLWTRTAVGQPRPPPRSTASSAAASSATPTPLRWNCPASRFLSPSPAPPRGFRRVPHRSPTARRP